MLKSYLLLVTNKTLVNYFNRTRRELLFGHILSF